MAFNVFVTRRIPQPGLDILAKYCDPLEVNPDDRVLAKEELIQAVRDRDGVLCLLTDKVDSEVIAAANKVRIFANYAVGFDNIDVTAATKRGILVTNTAGVLTDATADFAWALLFAIARRVVEADKFVRGGQFKGWAPMLFLGADIVGRTLGIVGAGRIGTAVALKSAGFNMAVLYTDAHPNPTLEEKVGAKQVALEELLRESDFISLHVPLLPETRHLIGEKQLRLMKKTAYLINTSRGAVVDEEALVRALKNGDLAGAALDVYENEPHVHPGLLELDNVVVAPHIASATTETRARMAVMAAENLIAGLQGRVPPNLVNPEVLKRP